MTGTVPTRANQLLLIIVMMVSAGLIVASGALGYYLGKHEATTGPVPLPTVPAKPTGAAVACTMEAKQCPDGSWVGRQPPRCAFAPCPSGPGKSPTATGTADTETVNFSACTVGGGFNRAVGFGSTSLWILKREAGICVVKTTNEVEGGVTASQCNVPSSLGTVTFNINMMGADFSAIKRYCNINSTTNINIQN